METKLLHNLSILGLLLVLLFFPGFIQSQDKKLPNIVIILVADLGYGDLSVNGGKDIYTPHIDKLFEKGMNFNNWQFNYKFYKK